MSFLHDRNAWTCPKCGEGYTTQSLDCHICGYVRPDPYKVIACRMYWDYEKSISELKDREGNMNLVESMGKRLKGFAKKHGIDEYV